MKKKIGPGLNNITTVEDAENILAAESKLVLAFLDALVVISIFSLANASVFALFFLGIFISTLGFLDFH